MTKMKAIGWKETHHLKDILAHQEQVKKVVATAYKLVSEDYNWDNIARDMKTRVFDKVA